MSRLINKNKVLSSFVAGLAIPLVIGGCTTLPEQQKPVAPSIEVAGAPAAVVTKTAPAPASVKTVPRATSYYDEYSHHAPAPTAPLVVEPVAPPAAEAAAVIPDDSIWARIRAGLRMEKLDPSLTRPHEQWFVENAEFRENMFERSKLYLYYIVEEVEKRGMPMEIALLPAIESAYKPYAYSRAKASGLWQFIPSTGKLYGL
jgi:membrane-bound lytic murein transglycosylase D